MPHPENLKYDSRRPKLSTTNKTISLLDLAEHMVTYGLKKGADEIEVTVQEGSEFSVDVRLGEIENLIEAGSRYISFRLNKDNKVASATSSDMELETLERLLEHALARAAFASPDPFVGLPELSGSSFDLDTYQLYDPSVPEISSESKIALARHTEALALDTKEITNSHGASFETREIRSVLANSNGFLFAYPETFCLLGVSLQAGGTNDLVEGYWSSGTRFFQDLESPEKIAQKAVQRTLRQLNPRKIPTQNVPVIFEPEMTGWLLGFLFSCISGISIYNHASFLVDRMGTRIGNEGIQVLDNGLLPRMLGTAPFDSEGVPCRQTEVITDGILKNYLCNTYSAKKLDLKSTGNASGGGVGPSNFFLKAGNSSPEAMIQSLDKGMILTQVLGHGLNPITGDISRGAFGLWVEKGEIVYPVSEITISGNLGTILNTIDMLGNDLKFRSPISGPSIRIAELTLAGT
jgi:PmbA protein